MQRQNVLAWSRGRPRHASLHLPRPFLLFSPLFFNRLLPPLLCACLPYLGSFWPRVEANRVPSLSTLWYKKKYPEKKLVHPETYSLVYWVYQGFCGTAAQWDRCTAHDAARAARGV
jgi:hypothetical protein